MSSNPLVKDVEYTVSVLAEEKVIGEVEIKRVGDGHTELVVLRDSCKDGFLMYVLSLITVQALEMAERNPAWRVKQMSWKRIFEARSEGAEEDDPPAPSTDDIPF